MKKKLTKKQIEQAWLRKLEREYPHMDKKERLEVLFGIVFNWSKKNEKYT